LGMLGRFDEARSLLAEVRAELADRGALLQLGIATGLDSMDLELLAGDPGAAVAFGEAGCRLFEQLGERAFLSTVAGGLEQALAFYERKGNLVMAERTRDRLAA